MADLQTQYVLLAQLKLLHEQASRLQVELDKIPVEIKELENGLEGRKLQFDSAKEALDLHKKQLREGEQDLRAIEDKILKAQEKLMEVKTNDAYSAASSEVEGQKGQKAKVEDRMLELMQRLEAENTVYKEAESVYLEFETAFKKEKGELDSIAARLKGELDEVLSKRASLAEGLDPLTSQLYKRVCHQIKAPIVEASQAMCSGCRIRLRPQLYNQILSQADVYQCPSCSRILIIKEKTASPDA